MQPPRSERFWPCVVTDEVDVVLGSLRFRPNEVRPVHEKPTSQHGIGLVLSIVAVYLCRQYVSGVFWQETAACAEPLSPLLVANAFPLAELELSTRVCLLAVGGVPAPEQPRPIAASAVLYSTCVDWLHTHVFT